MSTYTLAVLDMAGTTIRDNGIVEQSVRHAIGQVRPDKLDDEFSEKLHAARGSSKRTMFEQILDGPELADKALAIFEDALVDGVRAGVLTPIEGAASAMTQLREAGIKVALATGFSARVRNALLDHLGWRDIIDLSLGPEDGRSRPAPDLVLRAILHLQIDSVQQVAVVGDTKNDLLCGGRSGAGLVCGVLTGAHRRTDLEQVPHDALLDSIGDLPDVMASHATA